MLFSLGSKAIAQSAQFVCPPDSFEGRIWTGGVRYDTVDGCLWKIHYCKGAQFSNIYFYDAVYITGFIKLDSSCVPTKSEAEVITDIAERTFDDLSVLSIEPCGGNFTHYYYLFKASCWKTAPYHWPDPACFSCYSNTILYTGCDPFQHYCKKECIVCKLEIPPGHPIAWHPSCTTTQIGTPTCETAAPQTDWIPGVCYIVCQP